MAVIPGLWTSALAVCCILYAPTVGGICLNQTWNAHTYTFCSGSQNRADAEVTCTNIGMRLAIILTQEDYDHWRWYLLLNTLILGEVWVGATFSQAENEFMWDSNGGPVLHSFFVGTPDYSGVADGTCLRYNRFARLEWEDCATDDKGSFCQEPFPLTQETTTQEIDTTTYSETTVTDPASTTSTAAPTTTDTDQQTTSSASTAVTTTVTDTQTVSTETTSVTTAVLIPDTTQHTDTSTSAAVAAEVTTGTNKGTEDTTALATTAEAALQTTWTTSVSNEECYCSCLSPDIPTDEAQLEIYKQESREQIEKHLVVDTATLSSTVRRKTSAEDVRPSAQSVGYTGVILMVLSFSLILAMDVSRVWTFSQLLGRGLCCVKAKTT